MNSPLDLLRTLGKHRAVIAGGAAIGASGAVGALTGAGFTLTRTGAGQYQLRFSDPPIGRVHVDVKLIQAATTTKYHLATKAVSGNAGVDLELRTDPWGLGVQVEHETIVQPDAGGAAVHAQFTDDFDVTSGFTDPDVSRNVQAVKGANWPASVGVVVEGKNVAGTAVSEFLNPAAGATAVGVVAFALINRAFSSSDGSTPTTNGVTAGAGVTLDVQLAAAANTVFGLTKTPVAIVKVRANGLSEAAAAFSAANQTFRPTTDPTGGAVTYDVWYTHGAAAGTLTDPANGDRIEFEALVDNSDVTP